MDKFEYKTLVIDTEGFFGGKVDTGELEDRINMFGDAGWEMIGTTTTNQSYGASKSIVIFFKRRKNSDI